MRKIQSLTTRLVVYLFFAQLVAAFIPWLIVAYIASITDRYDKLDTTLEHYTLHRIHDLIVESFALAPDGSVLLTPSDELKRRLEKGKGFGYAALSARSGEMTPGSSQELYSTLTAAKETDARELRFHTADGANAGKWGVVTLVQTRRGPYYVAASGFEFEWLDVLSFIVTDRTFETVVFLVGWICSCSIVFLGLHSALGSLRSAAAAAERIDLDTMRQGIGATDAPTEIRPIIAAVNGALTRLDASVTRMRRFTASAAHELRTPLAVMCARLENEAPSPLKNDLLRDASRLHATVEQLLISARLSESQVTVDQEVDLTDTLCQIVADHSPLARLSSREIAFECDGCAVIVRGNQRAIESVVANLIGNALRSEPVGGTVFVRLCPDSSVAVIDHGEGVAPCDRTTIFEPFWRKSEATPGTGLGLAIAQELTEKLRGRIWVEETPGGGATFMLWLPSIRRTEGRDRSSRSPLDVMASSPPKTAIASRVSHMDETGGRD
ncbi:sensor histidine kinase [Methylosinus sporium]|uniref:sensor histidine kinase n=1 Tax=Methylosinus sporium TaxID=428 RepID=UPI00383AD697